MKQYNTPNVYDVGSAANNLKHDIASGCDGEIGLVSSEVPSDMEQD